MAKKEKMEKLTVLGVEYTTTYTNKYKNRKVWERPDEKLVTAYIPGNILKIFVKEGQKVKEGSKLLILEAMKMKNIVAAPVSGVVKSIKAKEGVMVPKNEILIELE